MADGFAINTGVSITIHHMKGKVISIPHTLTEDVDGTTFLTLAPYKCRSIGVWLTSYSDRVHRTNTAYKKFFKTKGGVGVKWIRWLQTVRMKYMKMAYHTRGPMRIRSRKKRERAQQLMADTIDVTLPTIGAVQSVETVMLRGTALTQRA